MFMDEGKLTLNFFGSIREEMLQAFPTLNRLISRK